MGEAHRIDLTPPANAAIDSAAVLNHQGRIFRFICHIQSIYVADNTLITPLTMQNAPPLLLAKVIVPGAAINAAAVAGTDVPDPPVAAGAADIKRVMQRDVVRGRSDPLVLGVHLALVASCAVGVSIRARR